MPDSNKKTGNSAYIEELENQVKGLQNDMDVMQAYKVVIIAYKLNAYVVIDVGAIMLNSLQHLHLQLGNLMAYGNRQETDDEGKVDAALILSNAQASLISEMQASVILEEFGLRTSPDVVINLIGDTAKLEQHTPDTEQHLVNFMQKVSELYAEIVRTCVFPSPFPCFVANAFMFSDYYICRSPLSKPFQKFGFCLC